MRSNELLRTSPAAALAHICGAGWNGRPFCLRRFHRVCQDTDERARETNHNKLAVAGMSSLCTLLATC
eukprot:6191241-Pleurochrysis_carterae.AAC.1